MFKKLLSNLPFNPSLLTEVSFYAKRLNRESSVRRVGFIFVALTLVVQVFAVISPAEASNKCSSNDVIRCGFSSQSQAVQQCNNNTVGFKTILDYYGITCATLAAASVQTVKSNSHGGQLYSMGRNPYQKPGEYGVDIAGAGKFYMRPLSSWGSTSYKMLVTKTPDGMPFMVMYDCANIVIQNGYIPPAKPEPAPNLKVNKVNEPKGSVKPGDTIKYTIAFTNKGGTAAFFSVNDRLDPGLEYVSSNSHGWPMEITGQNIKWYNNTPPFYTFGNTDVLGTPGFIFVTAKVRSNVKSGSSVCNTTWLNNVSTVTKKIQKSNEVTVCNKVEIECPEGTIAKPNGKCETPITPTEKTPILTNQKKAKNITQKIDNAHETVAAAGDIIEYTLITKNYGNGEAKDVMLRSENLADVLEYATLDFNSLDGAIFDQETQSIAWNKSVTIKPDQAITKTFRVKIKEPLPGTPSPVGNPGSFDLIMTNVYGNTIDIKLPKSIEKTTEQVTQTLPNTGPGEALVVGGLLASVVGYFFARSRLMAKELALVKQEYTTGA